MSESEDIVYRLAEPRFHSSVLKFLREHYYPDEPLANACNIREQNSDIEGFHMNILAKSGGPSLVATIDDCIIGTLLVAPRYPGEEKRLLREAYNAEDKRIRAMLLFMAHLERGSNVYERFNVDNALQAYGLGIHKDFRRKGIARKMLREFEKRARQLGYSAVVANATNIYSAKAFDNLGWTCINECTLADYREPGSDEQVLFSQGQQKFVKTFAMKIV